MATTSAAADSAAKARAKFSSRNVSAVYKAPASRGSDASGGYGSGGGLGNRMLVLRGSGRGSSMLVTAKAHAAAPTPINTPSLRREHSGQDVTVGYTPASGKSGWTDTAAQAEHGDVELDDAGSAHTNWQQHSPQQQQQRPSPFNIFGVGGGSGRWGDDAVDEDLAQSDIRQEQSNYRAPAMHSQHHQYHGNQDDPRFMSRYPEPHRYETRHSFAHAVQGYSYPRHGSPDDRTRQQFDQEDRYHGPHEGNQYRHSPPRNPHQPFLHSNQDARFDPQADGPRYVYERHYEDYHHREYHRAPEQDPRHYQQPGFHPRSYTEPVHRTRSHHLEQRLMHRESSSPDRRYPPTQNESNSENQTEHQIRTPATAIWEPNGHHRPTNPWKMSEAEVAGKTHSVSSSSSVKTSEPAPVRILKRTGPRMLFDPKTGTMVSVDEPGSRRDGRTKDVGSAPEVLGLKPPDGVPESTESNDRTIGEAPLAEESPAASARDEPPASSSAQVESVQADPLNHADAKSIEDEVPMQVVASSRRSDPRVKRRPIAGGRKRVIVTYRPVVKKVPDISVIKSEVAQDDHQTHRILQDESGKHGPVAAEDDGTEEERKGSNSAATTDEVQALKAKPRKSERKPGAMKKPQSSTDDPKLRERATRRKVREAGDTAIQRTREHRRQRPSIQRPTRSEVATVDAAEEIAPDSDHDDRPFLVVKSRRTQMLEKRARREAMEAALTGFHVRGGVQRTTIRPALSTSVARFGKRGITIGLREKSSASTEKPQAATESREPVTTIAPPPLVRSFKNVIHPPTSAVESKTRAPSPSKSPQDTGEVPSESGVERKMKPRRDRTVKVTREAKNVSLPTTEEKPRVKQRDVVGEKRHDLAQTDGTLHPPAAVKAEPTQGSDCVKSVVRPSTKPLRKSSRTNAPRLVYVPKQAQPAATGATETSKVKGEESKVIEAVLALSAPVEQSQTAPESQLSTRRGRRLSKRPSTESVAKNEAIKQDPTPVLHHEASAIPKALASPPPPPSKEQETRQPRRSSSKALASVPKAASPKHAHKTIKKMYVAKTASTAASPSAA